MFVRKWPIEYKQYTLYGFVVPLEHRRGCIVCGQRVRLGAYVLRDNYYDDETGAHMCEVCGEREIASQMEERREEDVDMKHVKVVRASEGVESASSILLGPSSDCGYPHPVVARNRLPAWFVLDCGKPVRVDVVRVHNWYHDSYPARVVVHGSKIDPEQQRKAALILCGIASRRKRGHRDVIKVIARYVKQAECWKLLLYQDLSKGSIWHDGEIEEPMVCQWIRLSFPRTLGIAPTMSIGVVQLHTEIYYWKCSFCEYEGNTNESAKAVCAMCDLEREDEEEQGE